MRPLCEVCGAGCVPTQFVIGGREYGRDRVGDNPYARGCCPGCDAAPGELHRIGCDVERCPRCGDRLSDCDCEPDAVTVAPGALADWQLFMMRSYNNVLVHTCICGAPLCDMAEAVGALLAHDALGLCLN